MVVSTPEGERLFTLQSGDHPYRALIEQMREGAATLTPEGVIHYCNQCYAEMLKLPLEGVMGSQMETFVVPGDRAALAAMLRAGEGRTELVLMAADATEVPALVSAISLRTEGPAAICLVVTDLTERKRHEGEVHRLNDELEARVVERTAQLAAAKDLLAVTLASIGDGVIVTETQGRVTFLNGEAERLTGWTSGEAEGHPLNEVFHIVNEHTRQPVEDPVEKVFRLGTVIGLANHTILIAKDGRETPIDDSGAPIRQGDGTIQGVVLVFRDATVEKQAQRSLARLAAIIESSEDAILSKDLKGIIQTWNAGAARMFGYQAEDVIGQPITLLLPPERVHEEEQILERVRNGQCVEHLETVRMTKDGRRLDVSVTVSPVKDHDGQIIGVSKILRDITNRKRAKEERQRLHALAAREKDRLSALVSSITDEIWFADTEERFTLTNPSASQEFGLGVTDGTDVRRLAESLEVLRPDGSPRPVEEAPPLRALRGEVVRNQEEIVRTPATGELRYRQVSSSPVRDAKGDIIGSVSVVRDVTERKRAEEALRESHERLKKVLEVETVGVMFWDLTTGYMTDANDAFLTLMGYSRREVEARELTWQKLTPPEYLDVSLAEIRKFQATGRVGPYEKEYFRKDGTRRWLVFAGSSLGNNTCVEFCVNIADRKQAEQRIKAALGEKDVLLKEIHHRVKNNMQVISSLVALQAERLQDPSMRDVLQDVTHRVRSMALVHEKLYQSADMAHVEFAEYVQSLMTYLWHAHGTSAAGIRLTLDLEPVQLSVNAAVPCGLILNELATNALKHAFRGRGESHGGDVVDSEVAVSLRGA